MSMQGSLTIEHMCHLAQVSRTGFYRFLQPQPCVEQDMEVRGMIHQIAVEYRRRYGYRRMKKELFNRGLLVSHKRVLRLMEEDNLLALRRRKYVSTTQSQHSLKVHLNVAARMELTGINQLWLADITYIRLQKEWVYLAIVLDAFSRKIVGWALDRTLTTRLTITALQQALAERKPPPGLVHHSDRGVQYAAEEYVRLLLQYQIIPSMSRAGNPWDNAACESFMKTFKVEEIYLSDYRDFEDALINIGTFIEDYYNRRRLHSALNYRSPEDFEQQVQSSNAAIVSFRGMGKSIDTMGEQSPKQKIAPDPSNR
jgi:putative transposase